MRKERKKEVEGRTRKKQGEGEEGEISKENKGKIETGKG